MLSKPSDDLCFAMGLLIASGRKVSTAVAPSGMLCPLLGDAQLGSDWSKFQHEPDIYPERQMRYSISRRLSDVKAQ